MTRFTAASRWLPSRKLKTVKSSCPSVPTAHKTARSSRTPTARGTNGAALLWGFKDAFSNVYTLGDVTDGDKGEIIDEALNVEDESIVDWFTMRIGAGGLYVSNNGSKSYISLTTSKTTYADADLWRRMGNDTEGYTIINKEAGPDMVLAAPVKMLGTTGGESYPIMVNKNKIPEGYTALWQFAKSSNLGNNVEAYYMYEKGYTSNKVNNRDGKFAFWNGGADAGSTIRWEWAQRDISVNMATGSFTTSNGTWAKTWTSKAGEPKLVLDAGYNNMNVTASDETRIQAYVGKYTPQAYTLSAGAEYSIAAYSFDFVMADNTAVKVIDASGKSYTTTKTPQSLACKGLKMPTASFTLSGANAGVILTNFKVSIRKAYIEPEPQVEISRHAHRATSHTASQPSPRPTTALSWLLPTTVSAAPTSAADALTSTSAVATTTERPGTTS